MLIGDSLPKLLFIRSTILSLRLIAPASVLYCIIFPIVQPTSFFHRPWPLPLSIWALAEAGFFLIAYLPRKFLLQKEAVHPKPPSKAERQLLFQRSVDSTPNVETYISGWFLGAPWTVINRENVKEFYAWSLMNKKYEDVDHDEEVELDGYVDRLEEVSGKTFVSGRGEAHGLRGTIESVYMQHRPLIWYMIIGLVDCITITSLQWNGFTFRREAFPATLATLPIRPHTLFSRPSPVPRLSYWYREHTSKTKLPILFIHGIGVGLHTYVDFLINLSSNIKGESDDGDVGIIAVEILPISARISNPALVGDKMRDEIRKVVQFYGWEEFVLAGHSYGSAIAVTIIRDPDFSKQVKAAVLMDPISFLLHLPDVAYNFTRRKPTSASEHMLYYFSSQDMMISHTLARRFFWSQYVLWKEDISGLPLTVTLSGRDIIVPTKAVWKYLTGSLAEAGVASAVDGDDSDSGPDDTVDWQDGMLRVLWFQEFNHADLFASKGATRGVAGIVREYSLKYGSTTSGLTNGVSEG